ncbi:AbiH family protein [Polaribacter sp. R2A056_3_33]|nr:AbiH family protein [Polaribacter sp. R2A056_3_33]
MGNGFDLALGLKTSYNDFLFWLLKPEVENS